MTCVELLIEYLTSLKRHGDLDIDDYIEMPIRDLIDGISAFEKEQNKK